VVWLKYILQAPFKDCKATIIVVTLSSHMPTDRAKELFKPSADSGCLLVSFQKNCRFRLLVGDVTMRACFCLFGQVYLTLGANSKSRFSAQVFFGNYALIRDFRILNWLYSSSKSGPRIWAQKPNFWQKSKSCRKSVICPLTAKLGHPQLSSRLS